MSAIVIDARKGKAVILNDGLRGPMGPAGPKGDKGDKGDKGNPGADGSTILHGADDPLSSTGRIDDFYINTTTLTIFGPKSSAGWGSGKGLGGGGVVTPTLPVVVISAAQSKAEGDTGTTVFTYTVTRSGDVSKTASVNWALTGAVDATDLAVGQATSGVLNFAINATTATITVGVKGDATVETDEIFTLTLSNPVQAQLGSPASATGTVLNDDVAPGAPVFPSTVDTGILPISIRLASALTAYPVQMEIGNLGDAQTGDVLWLEQRAKNGSVVNRFYHVITDADQQQPDPKVITFAGLSAITTGTWRWLGYRAVGTSVSGPSNQEISGGDDIEPALSSLSAVAVGSSGGKVLFSTDTAEGIAKAVFVIKDAAAPSQSTMDASSFSLTVTAIGAQELSGTGLSAATAYDAYVQHTDVAGNKTPITKAGTFTTAASVAFGMSEVAAPATDINPSNSAIAGGKRNSYTGLAFGAAAPTRLLVAFVTVLDYTAEAVKAVSIGGVTATRLSAVPTDDQNAQRPSVWIAAVPNGTSGDVVVDTASSASFVNIKLWRLVGSSAVPTQVVGVGWAYAETSINVSTPAGGGTILVGRFNPDSGVATPINNATQVSSTQNGWGTFVSAQRTTTGLATVNFTGFGAVNAGIAAVSFAP